MTKVTRRTVLAATAAAVAAGGPALAVNAPASSDSALLALEIRWRAAVAQVNKADAEYSAIYDALPPHAQDGWSTVPAAGDGLFLKHHAGKPIGLQEIRSFNQACVVDDQWAWGKSPARVARIRAEGRQRIRWWIAARREMLRVRAASGLGASGACLDAAYQAMDTLEDEILAAPAEGVEGLRVKLVVLARTASRKFQDDKGAPLPREEWGPIELAVADLHAEAERIAGRARA
jgi:hypothetical protein